MFYKLCAKCGAVIPLGETYCDKCRPIEKVTREELQVDDRKGILARDKYLCVACAANGRLSVASDVHHIVRVKQNWNKRFDPSNCISLCKECHNKADKTGVVPTRGDM